MSIPLLDEEHLNYKKIPMEFRHQRSGLHKIYNNRWEKLDFIPDWENIDLNGTFVQTKQSKLIDPEIIELTQAEKNAVIRYFVSKDRDISLCSSFVVRDNWSGYIYLPQDCQVLSL